MPASPAGSSDLSNRSRIINRVERDIGVPIAGILSDRVAPADLQSLLLEVYARRAMRRDPKILIHDHLSNRFTQPSASDPRRLLEWDRIAFSKLPRVFRPVELSPVCPFGVASVLSPISQDWIVSTTRNSEVVADSTNVLALECAVRRRVQKNFSTGHATPGTPCIKPPASEGPEDQSSSRSITSLQNLLLVQCGSGPRQSSI